jgi:Gas vesicle protein G
VGLLSFPFRLPFLPAKSVVKLAEVVRDEVDRQYYDPSAVRREVEEAGQAAESGEIPPEEATRRQQQALSRLTRPRPAAADPAGDGAGEGEED